jgi:hypothetical protein
MKLIAILRRGGCLGLQVGEEEFLPEVLEMLNGAAARKVKLGWWNDVMEKEYPRRNYL